MCSRRGRYRGGWRGRPDWAQMAVTSVRTNESFIAPPSPSPSPPPSSAGLPLPPPKRRPLTSCVACFCFLAATLPAGKLQHAHGFRLRLPAMASPFWWPQPAPQSRFAATQGHCAHRRRAPRSPPPPRALLRLLLIQHTAHHVKRVMPPPPPQRHARARPPADALSWYGAAIKG
jgi:hypothetical protein